LFFINFYIIDFSFDQNKKPEKRKENNGSKEIIERTIKTKKVWTYDYTPKRNIIKQPLIPKPIPENKVKKPTFQNSLSFDDLDNFKFDKV